MRVLFVTPYVPSRIRIRPLMFLRELARRHEVSVLTLWATARERQDLSELMALYPAVGVHLSSRQVLRNCLRALATGTPLQGAYGYSPELSGLVQAAVGSSAGPDVSGSLALRGPFDLVHVEHLRAAYLGAVIPASVPKVVDAVDCISLLLARTRAHSHSPKQRLLAAFELPRMRRYEPQALGRFDGVTATSPVDAAALRALDPRLAPTVITNGVDIPGSTRVEAARDPDVIVFAGKMSYHANATAACYFARQVLPIIQAQRPRASFHIVGSDPPREVRALSKQPGVVVTGYVADVTSHVRQATVAVAPMLVKVGVQNKVLEAMAVGTPIVATPAGVEGLGARPGEDLLVGSDPAELADRVLSVLGQAELRDRLAAAGRIYVDRYHRWEAIARSLEDVYARVVATKAPGSAAARSA